VFLAAQVEDDPELFKISQPLEEKIIQFQPKLNNKVISRSDLGEIMESEPDRDVREKGFYSNKVLDDQIEEGVVNLFDKRNALARKLGYKDYVELGLKLQDIVETELRNLFIQVKELTQELWEKTLVEIATELGVSKIQPWDLAYYLHSVLRSPPSERFPKSGIIPAFKSVLKEAGGDLDDLPIRVYERDIPYGGLCMGIQLGKDIRILANPRDGLMWYDALFHEFGHGIHS